MNWESNDDRNAFLQMVQPLLERAGGYAYSIVGNHADAEDAVQEAMWKGYRGLAAFDRDRSFKAWWFAIIRNCCRDILQRRRTRPRTLPFQQADQLVAHGADASEPLRESLATLTPMLREILELKYFGGFSYREIAESLAIPLGTVMSRLHAARLALAAAYGKE